MYIRLQCQQSPTLCVLWLRNVENCHFLTNRIMKYNFPIHIPIVAICIKAYSLLSSRYNNNNNNGAFIIIALQFCLRLQFQRSSPYWNIKIQNYSQNVSLESRLLGWEFFVPRRVCVVQQGPQNSIATADEGTRSMGSILLLK